MNVIHICSYYYGSKLYKNLFDRLNTLTEIEVFAPCDYSFDDSSYSEDYLMKSKCFKSYDRLFFHYKYRKVFNEFNRLYRDADIIHAHSLFSNGYIAYKNKLERGIPYIVAVRNTDVNTFFKKAIHLRNLGVEILNHASRIVFLSKSYKDTVINKYVPDNLKDMIESKSVIIPNGIDQYWLDNRKVHKCLDKNKLNLVFVGTVDSNKNIKTVIELCNKILKYKYDLTLNIVGPCNDKRIIKLLDNTEFIKYHGKQNKEYITEVFRQSDIFIMPSKHETFGLVYAEAISQGLPVIYTCNEGFDQQFKDGEVGYAVNPKDIKEMSHCIEKILLNYEGFSKRCYENSLRFNWDSIASTYIDLYNDVINEEIKHNENTKENK